MKTGHWFGAGILVGAGLIALLAARWSGESAPAEPPPAAREAPEREAGPMTIDLNRTSLTMIPAATVIGDKPPAGWTNLIYTMAPVISDADRKKLPESASFYAQLLRYVMLAKV